MLEQLPQEIFDFILNLLSMDDVKNLSLTSKHLHSATLEAVWESIVIPAWNKNGIFGIKLADFPLDRILLARHIYLRFIDEDYSRICLHSQKLQLCREAADESIIARPAAFSSVEEILISLLEECEKDYWKSFRNMYTGKVPETAIDLSAFTHLLDISWRGLNSENLKTLAIALRNNKSHLESLELDLIDWPHMRRELGYQSDSEVVHGLKARDYINEKVFGLDKLSPCIKFPNLHTLVLSQVPLSATLAETVDFEILKSLTIRSCPLWYEFVLTMAQRKIPVKLRKLELQESWPKNDEGSIYMDEDDPIAFLLDSFEGLEEFYLSQVGGMRSILTWHHVCHHKSTLKIFVNHSRFYEERNRRWWDQPDMMLRDWNTTPFKNNPTSTPLYQLDTEFISLSCTPKFPVTPKTLFLIKC
ncbi:uncharacterized protein LW94_3265 [Fusarium fujikuroi]|nr:uncharacterized protein LW94_3265 [Fusarium fujikuroi]